MDEDNKVPSKKLLDDMHNPNIGFISQAAEDYYYCHYATEDEKNERNRSERNIVMLMAIGISLFIIFIILILVYYTFII